MIRVVNDVRIKTFLPLCLYNRIHNQMRLDYGSIISVPLVKMKNDKYEKERKEVGC